MYLVTLGTGFKGKYKDDYEKGWIMVDCGKDGMVVVKKNDKSIKLLAESKTKLKLSEAIKLIESKTGKKVILTEYFVNEKSKINDVGGLNILNDMDDEMIEEIGIESQKLIKKYQPIAKKLAAELKPYMKQPIPAELIDKIDDSWYDGSDAYDGPNAQERYLPGIYDSQIKVINKLIAALKK